MMMVSSGSSAGAGCRKTRIRAWQQCEALVTHHYPNSAGGPKILCTYDAFFAWSYLRPLPLLSVSPRQDQDVDCVAGANLSVSNVKCGCSEFVCLLNYKFNRLRYSEDFSIFCCVSLKCELVLFVSYFILFRTILIEFCYHLSVLRSIQNCHETCCKRRSFRSKRDLPRESHPRSNVISERITPEWFDTSAWIYCIYSFQYTSSKLLTWIEISNLLAKWGGIRNWMIQCDGRKWRSVHGGIEELIWTIGWDLSA